MRLRETLMAGFIATAVFAATQTAVAVTIFSETFDNNGAFDNPGNWTTASDGRIELSGFPSTASGNGALWMDSTSSPTVNRLNEAILTLDLTGCGPVCWLSFFWAESGDNQHLLPSIFTGSFDGDGVSISNDGSTWHTILNAPDAPDANWLFAMFDLATEAANTGISLGANFQIKFQQFDNTNRPDGRGYDEVVIESHGIPEPGTLAIMGIGLAGLGLARRRKLA